MREELIRKIKNGCKMEADEVQEAISEALNAHNDAQSIIDCDEYRATYEVYVFVSGQWYTLNYSEEPGFGYSFWSQKAEKTNPETGFRLVFCGEHKGEFQKVLIFSDIVEVDTDEFVKEMPR